MPTNKEIIDLLTEYFLKQDQKEIAHALAGCIIDFNRLSHVYELDQAERESLFKRIELNSEQLHEFLKDPKKTSKKPFTIKIHNSDV